VEAREGQRIAWEEQRMKKQIRVVTPVVTEGLHVPEDVRDLVGPDTEVSLVQIMSGPASIESAFDSVLAAPEVVGRVLEAERDGVDAVVIDCMDDPALEAAREAVSIPVLGPSQTSMHLASLLGHRFSIVTVLDRSVAPFEDQARRYGLEGNLASVRWISIPVLELDEDRDLVVSELVRESLAAIEQDGAHVVIFGCTGMLGCAAGVREGLRAAGWGSVPVIDPIPATLRVAEALVEAGLSHSKRTYPDPPVKARVGYGFAGIPG
jgi:allantoin racemase